MSILAIQSMQQIEEGQAALKVEHYARKAGSYKIADLIGGVSNHMQSAPQGQVKGRKTALISGAGIAGLTAAFELNAKGYDVVIAEKRSEFSRFNIINLNMEAQAFLRKFELLDEFEETVAARIEKHITVAIGKEGPEHLGTNNVSELQFEGHITKDPTKFEELFQKEGIYSVQIKDLQAFLAHKAAKLGVQILSESEIKVVKPLKKERVSRVEIIQKGKPTSPFALEPDLFFIAEGAHSTTVRQLEMEDDLNDEVTNDCTSENWVYGNLNYRGDKTFVISMVITTEKTLQIANVIFNAKSGIVNVAVTSDEHPSPEEIQQLILAAAQKAFNYGGITEKLEVFETIKQPVRTTNLMASICSKGNIFRIGDAVGNSSPLAGLGGTLGLTLVPRTVENLCDDLEKGSDKLHGNFQAYSQAYVSKWIDKSVTVKRAIQGIFDKSHPQNEES